MIRLAVMASGGGSNFQVILDRIRDKSLDAKVALLISNNSKSGAMEKARNAGIETLHLPPSKFQDEAAYTKKLLGYLKQANAQLIVLAGYMKRIPEPVVSAYRNRILNIHPALLPSFGGKSMYGHHVHKAVIEYGAKITGVTVHLIDEVYDHGPIIMQRAVEIESNDTPETLAARVLKVEHDTYWRAVQLFAAKRIHVHDRKVIIS